MPEKVIKDLKNIYSLGKEKYYQFTEERFKSNSKSTGDTIHATTWACLASLERRPRQQGG